VRYSFSALLDESTTETTGHRHLLRCSDARGTTVDFPHSRAQAAHDAELDGLVWMSRLCNDAKAYTFFGDRCDGAFTQDSTFGRLFATGAFKTNFG
jgi:hypothetical protein